MAVKLWLQPLGTRKTEEEICLAQFPFVIGRRSDSQVCLPYTYISRRHCRFVNEGDRVLVQDLESLGGTFVNGKRATVPLLVTDGDELTLGPLSFRVVMPRGHLETAVSILPATQTDIAVDAAVQQS